MAAGITDIVLVDESTVPQMAGSVAAVSRTTGVMYINRQILDKLKAEGVIDKEGHVLSFIMMHEAGHVALDSDDELAVDEWAFWQYINSEPTSPFVWGRRKSLQKSVYALTRILKFQKGEDFVRAQRQLDRALKYDGK